jgi:hypothetical protein
MDSEHSKSQKNPPGIDLSKDSRISNKITQSLKEREKEFLKNPEDYEKIIEVIKYT